MEASYLDTLQSLLLKNASRSPLQYRLWKATEGPNPFFGCFAKLLYLGLHKVPYTWACKDLACVLHRPSVRGFVKSPAWVHCKGPRDLTKSLTWELHKPTNLGAPQNHLHEMVGWGSSNKKNLFMFCWREPWEPMFILHIQTEWETYYKTNLAKNCMNCTYLRREVMFPSPSHMGMGSSIQIFFKICTEKWHFYLPPCFYS